MSIKKEIQQFIIACEKLHRLLSRGEHLTCHEAEILHCCIEELIKRRVTNPNHKPKDSNESAHPN